jgi:ligand-binding sensor domain-containing protein
VQVADLSPGLPGNGNSKLVKGNNENIWLLCDDHLLQYNHKIKKLVRSTDLSSWQPQSVLLEEERIWLISNKDGLLYGLSL